LSLQQSVALANKKADSLNDEVWLESPTGCVFTTLFVLFEGE
jgi:hypothetical protein